MFFHSNFLSHQQLNDFYELSASGEERIPYVTLIHLILLFHQLSIQHLVQPRLLQVLQPTRLEQRVNKNLLLSSNTTFTKSPIILVLLLYIMYVELFVKYPKKILSSLLGSNFPKCSLSLRI